MIKTPLPFPSCRILDRYLICLTFLFHKMGHHRATISTVSSQNTSSTSNSIYHMVSTQCCTEFHDEEMCDIFFSRFLIVLSGPYSRASFKCCLQSPLSQSPHQLLPSHQSAAPQHGCPDSVKRPQVCKGWGCRAKMEG